LWQPLLLGLLRSKHATTSIRHAGKSTVTLRRRIIIVHAHAVLGVVLLLLLGSVHRTLRGLGWKRIHVSRLLADGSFF
jgi:hypothetical protein